MRPTTGSLLGRIRRLENEITGQLMEIVIKGGLQNDELQHAQAGNLAWQRQPDEPEAAFKERVRAEALAAGNSFLIFGGLPED